ncbi:hypothetical protein A3D66_01370 [Candidatus Kaiserbacteria bacterium RIFCSPHIGHO2_02_FULL_50_9]|uniref:Pilus assembly protein PilO n=1 Tax=Candidatus Kaiserbacteria bacterium RIFCSPLOWO2_01_FULL_51_21 TaxID=1798508 RepID=A0A1F6ECP8_9BACT|nr:MAG: hypothetical protein A2761_01030 [Candidatus Kaiserbacteria bacterium RIFCSPHIGHO2_01_FULL_51_33]OGG63294.1 MAG: hypothetical protein A3D66_01370 [Candidatus Kaiserbacteria bacterium RIFCSPHIGHO2_02_FULL_50_9]OGG71448.1 MAG: hypothetical protein A3A35_03320 [Candidatus Kaiserbacteria bacterium RIFCSPLOWO2_01_FULL_51_21]
MKLVFPIVAIVVALGVFFSFVDPRYQGIKELRAQEKQFDEALTRSKDLRSIRDEKLKVYNSFPPEDIDRLQKLLPDHIDNIRLVMDLDTAASKYGMRLTNVSVGKPDEGPAEGSGQVKPYGSISVTFSVTTTYESFLRFLTDLETSLRLVDVVSLSFSRPRGDVYEYTITLRTYWLK